MNGRARLGDALVAAAAVLVVTVAIDVAREPGARPADTIAYTIGVLMAAPLLARRRWPLGVLLVVAGVLLGYYSLRYPAITPALPLAVPLYTASAAGRLRWALAVIGFYLGADLLVPLLHHYQAPLLLLAQVTERALGMVALALLGHTVRNRRLRLAAADEQLRELSRRRAAEAAQQLSEQRLRIARDIHDSVGHGISAITIQAALAGEALDRQPEQARSALAAIRATSRQALAELHTAVGVIRVGDEPAGLDDLDALLAPARSAGLRVEVYRDRTAAIPAPVDRAAHRIIQESMTNVLRHASASVVTVGLRRDGTDLLVEVTDDGRGTAAGSTAAGHISKAGHGIAGMAERCVALGGQLTACAGPHGGFVVSARLPLGAGAG